MTVKYIDRVFETTQSSGTGIINLDGPVTNFQSFALAGNNGRVGYMIDEPTKWEIGIGTVLIGSPNQLARTTVLASSNSNVAVNLGAGNVKNVRLLPIAALLLGRDEGLNFSDLLGASGGSANAHTVTMPVAPLSYTNGALIMYRALAANTTAGVSVNVNGVGVKALKVNGIDPGVGRFATGTLVIAVFNSANDCFDVFTMTGDLPLTGGTLTGSLNTAKGNDIASAATTDIGAATGNYVTITGATTIIALGTAPTGAIRNVRFADALTLTHNATSLNLKTSANIVTAAGDTAEFVSEGGGNWRMLDYQRADGKPLSGSGLNPLSMLYVRDERASGTNGGSSIAGIQTRTLNATPINNISGASLNTTTNQVTLPAGTYYVRGTANCYGASGPHKARLYNVTDSTYMLEGTNEQIGTADDSETRSHVNGLIILSSPKVFELRHYIANARGTIGLGRASSQGTEIYSEIEFWKVS